MENTGQANRGARRATALALALAASAGPAGAGGPDPGGCAATAVERVIPADPSTYLALLPGLVAGDLLRLAPGTYSQGLPLADLAGEPGRCIVIEGPAAGPPARFPGRDCCNTVSIVDSSYLVIRRLELDGEGRQGDAVKAEGTAAFSHHVTLEGLFIHGHDADQQIVSISTKCPAWNWVIRGNVIAGAGTGLYLGNSDGEDEFSNGLIEHNLVVETLGYNLQIKHQNGRAVDLGAPAAGTTVIRHNVFSKAVGSAGGDAARPNVLVGHPPLSGPGSDDDTRVYGNFFWQNPTEALFQGEGHLAIYANLFVNGAGPAVHVQPHEDVPRRVRIFANTVVATGAGLRVLGGHPSFEQRLAGNAVFAAPALTGGIQVDNLAAPHAAAPAHLVHPAGGVAGADRLDLYPLPGTLAGAPWDATNLTAYPDWDRDFQGAARDRTSRGAYEGEGATPTWLPALEIKPSADLLFADGFESGGLGRW